MPTPYADFDKAKLIPYDCEGNELQSDEDDDDIPAGFKEAYADASARRFTGEGRSPPPNTPKGEKRSIIGVDDRARVAQGDENKFPFCAIGDTEDKNVQCTAFFISPHHALTAAHCVFHETIRPPLWLSSQDMQRARNCRNKGNKHTCMRVYVPKGWTSGEDLGARLHYDYALIVYQNPSPCFMSFGFIDKWPGLGLTIVGYPTDKRDRRAQGCRVSAMCKGCSGNSIADPWFIDHQVDALLGNSGSPMYASDLNVTPPGQLVAYGVLNQEVPGKPLNRGVRITKHLWHQLVAQLRKDGQNVVPSQ